MKRNDGSLINSHQLNADNIYVCWCTTYCVMVVDSKYEILGFLKFIIDELFSKILNYLTIPNRAYDI